MLSAAALQAALAFNLACPGTERAGPLGLSVPDQPPTSFSITYRIDMDLRRWCSGECARTEAIGSVVFGHILLPDQRAASGRHVIDFDSVTGGLTDTLTDGDLQILRHGTCKREPLTGFSGLMA